MSGRRFPLRSMWEAGSDFDHDADNGNSEGDAPMGMHEHAHQCPGCDRQSYCYASGCATPLTTYCGDCSTKAKDGTLPLPKGFRHCIECGALCRPDVTLDRTGTKCSWCAWTRLKAMGQHDDEATDEDPTPRDDD